MSVLKTFRDEDLDALWFNLISEKLGRACDGVYFSRRFVIATELSEMLTRKIEELNHGETAKRKEVGR